MKKYLVNYATPEFYSNQEEFSKKALGKDIAMQVASMEPKNVKDLENQDFIKDPSKKVSDLIKEVIAKTGENIKIGRIYRLELGK